MATIGPEAQALIDRLHAVDIARPRLDVRAVETAFNRHLVALSVRQRSIGHIPDASSGYRNMIAIADAASRPAATPTGPEADRAAWEQPSLAFRDAEPGP